LGKTLKNPRPQLQAVLAESGGTGMENGVKKKDESAKKKKKVEKGVCHICARLSFSSSKANSRNRRSTWRS